MITGQFDVEFTRDGVVFDDRQVTTLLAGLGGAGDLLVLVHGWNNDRRDAGELYDELLANIRGRLPAGSAVAVLRAFWPSKKFADADLIPGGGAASAADENVTALHDQLAALGVDPHRLGGTTADPARAANLAAADALVEELETAQEARREFVLRVRAVLDPTEAHPDDGSADFFTRDPEELFEQFALPVALPEGLVEAGGAADLDGGGAAGFVGDLMGGMVAAGRRIANFATYYQMKTRAGVVGRTGLAATLLRVRDRRPDLPVHLVGHSFGGRAVTAAAAALPAGTAPMTLSLLQAAFSHNGLAERFDGRRDGQFRTLLREKRVSGPILITHTKSDLAVGVAYPLASRVAGDDSAGLGDREDPYGGMGRNGAQHTPEVSATESRLHPAGAGHTYRFARGGVYNLGADGVIAGHGDVRGPAVAEAVVQAVRVR